MSYAGHILDMIQRMKQNRLLQRSKREQIRDVRDQWYEKKRLYMYLKRLMKESILLDGLSILKGSYSYVLSV